MLSKIFLLLASVVTALSTPLQVTPEELKNTYEIIFNDLFARQGNADSELRALTTVLENYRNETINSIISDLTAASKLYWDEVNLLEAVADSKDEDISACIEVGNEEFYALNRSVISEASAIIDQILQDALNEIIECTDVCEEALAKLQDFSDKIDECSDDTCATIIEGELVEYYQAAIKMIDDSTSTASNYVFIYLPQVLAEITIDIEEFQKSYQDIIDEIRACMNSNVTEAYET